jgi:hypothetical protein
VAKNQNRAKVSLNYANREADGKADRDKDGIVNGRRKGVEVTTFPFG